MEPQPATSATERASRGLNAGAMTPEEAEKRKSQLQETKERFQEQADHSQAELEHARSEGRRPLYKDVEDLLLMGFLSHTVQVGTTDLSIRSLSPGDTFLLRHRVGTSYNDRNWKVWSLASAVWMVDGMNLLPHPDSASLVYATLQTLPSAVTDILFSNLMGLIARSTSALYRTEAYCYEPYSRINWRYCGQQAPTETFSGVPGASRLGLNHIQRMWLAYNIAEDGRLRHIQEWQSAKLVASSNNPKGVKKLNASDENLRKTEDRRRHDAIERMLRVLLYGDEAASNDDTGTMVVMVRGQAVTVPRVRSPETTEELADEMRRWVGGDKDWHDIVVDTYKERVRSQYDQERKQRDGQLAAVQREVGVTSNQTPMVGYTLDQIREFRPDLAARSSNTKRVFDGDISTGLFQKYVKAEVDPGRLVADEGGVRELPKPDVEPVSLQSQMGSRRPAFSTEPIGPGGVKAPTNPQGNR